MVDASARPHWLLAVIRAAGLEVTGAPAVSASTPLAEAWTTLARACNVSDERIAEAVGARWRLPLADLAKAQPHATQLVPEKLARSKHLFALRESEQRLVVATADPTDLDAEQLLGFSSGRRVDFEVATPAAIQEAIDGRYAPDSIVERLLTRVGAELANAVTVLEDEQPEQVSTVDAASGPIIKLTNVILADAVRARASDIHLEPSSEGGRVRFRVDGVLQTYTTIAVAILSRVISRLKILGKMDIADRLRPQDGRARIGVDGREIDLRISTVPTRDAEKAVLRLLDSSKSMRLSDLSFTEEEMEPLRALLGRRDGIVVVTGPTGSGKTTLLYAALREMPTGDLNIMTVEDPVEYELAGLTQIQVEPKRDVTFSTALKSILRQDPDVIFIGEIRDAETAAIAVQASLTGHLVLASLHTNDAVGAVARFVDLGVDRSAIASTLRGATAQRLIRRVCTRCAVKVTGALTPEETKLAARYGVQPVVRAVGCTACGHTGFFGRIPLIEIMLASPALEARIIEGAPASQLQIAAIASGMRPLREAAVTRVRNGDTTLEEIDRELGEADDLKAAAEARPSGALAAIAPSDAPSGTAGSAASSTAGHATAMGTHVIIADDDATSRAIATALLKKSGYRVSQAEDGATALELVRASHDAALLVLDYDMPKLNGEQVLQELRGDVRTSTLPVLVLTGATDSETEVRMMDAGADDYVRKPLDPERFVARVRAVLKRASLQRA